MVISRQSTHICTKKGVYMFKERFTSLTILILVLCSSMLYSQTRDWEEMYQIINRSVVDMVYTTIDGIYEDGLLFALPGDGGGLGYFTGPNDFEIFNFSSNLGMVSVVPDDDHHRIFCAFGRGTWSDGLYVFDPITEEFEIIDWYVYPNFVKKLSSGFYYGHGFDDYGGLIYSATGDEWSAIPYFANKNVQDIEETVDGILFIATGDELYIKDGDEYHMYQLDLVINDIYVRNYPFNNEVYIAVGDGTDSDAVYRVEYDNGEITGLTFINYFYQPQKIYNFWNYLVVGCNGQYGNLFLIEAEEDGQLLEIGSGLGISEVFCFEFYPIYTHNFLVATDNGIFLGTNFEFTAIEESRVIFSTIKLANYPNPFNPVTTIDFILSQAGITKLSIYNIKGERIRVLDDSYRKAGKHSLIWDGCDDSGNELPSGVYIGQLIREDEIQIRKMTLLK